MGCRGGTSGSLAAGCLPCPIGKLCPGLTSRPLYNFSGSEGQWDAAVRGGRRTAVAVGLWAACPPLLLQPPLAPATASTLQQTMSLNFSSTNARTVVAGLAFICLVLLLLLAYCCWRRIRNPFETAAKFFDSYALRHQVPEGSAPEKRTTPMGGIFTLLALLTIACFTSYLVLEWQTNNLLVQRSLDVLTPDVWVSTAGLGWATAPVGGTQPPDSASLLIRITVDGESGACAMPLQSSATGLVAGNWSLIGSTANCAGTGASQLTYSCTGCQLGPSAALSLLFHYSCQSLFLEAASFPAYPRGTLSRQLLGAVAGSPGAPLTDIDWTLIPTLSVVWDNVTIENERGLMFTYSGSSSTGRALPLTATGLLVQPLAASLNLTILLPQSPTYIVTLLTLRVTLVQLLASILGLSSVLGAFGAAFGVTEGALAWVRTRGRAALKEKGRELRQALSKRLSSKLFSVGNPLRAGGENASAATAPLAPPAQQPEPATPTRGLFPPAAEAEGRAGFAPTSPSRFAAGGGGAEETAAAAAASLGRAAAAAAVRGGEGGFSAAGVWALAQEGFDAEELPPGWDWELSSATSDNSGGVFFIMPGGDVTWEDPRDGPFEDYAKQVARAAEGGANLSEWLREVGGLHEAEREARDAAARRL